MGKLARERDRPLAKRARHVAGTARRRVEADERRNDGDDRSGQEYSPPHGQPEAVHPHAQHGEGGEQDDDPAAVSSRLAPADGGEDEREDRRKRPPPEEGRRLQRHGEQHRFDQVPRPVEAASPIRPRTDRREGVHLRPGCELDQVGGNEPDERIRKKPRRNGDEEAAPDREHRQPQDDMGRAGDLERREHEGARENGRCGEQAGPREVTGAQAYREQRAPEYGTDQDQRRPEAYVVGPREAEVEPSEVRRRALVGHSANHGLCSLREGTGRRCHVGDRDEAADARRVGDEDSVIAAADDRDRVATRVRVAAGRRQGDVDRHRSGLPAEFDQPLSARDTPQARGLDLAADERRQRALTASGFAGAGDEQTDGSA